MHQNASTKILKLSNNLITKYASNLLFHTWITATLLDSLTSHDNCDSRRLPSSLLSCLRRNCSQPNLRQYRHYALTS